VNKTQVGCLLGALAGLIQLPIGIFLQFNILHRVEASELMWFLFWINVPTAIVVSVLANTIREMK
jgi:hypothetical protein